MAAHVGGGAGDRRPVSNWSSSKACNMNTDNTSTYTQNLARGDGIGDSVGEDSAFSDGGTFEELWQDLQTAVDMEALNAAAAVPLPAKRGAITRLVKSGQAVPGATAIVVNPDVVNPDSQAHAQVPPAGPDVLQTTDCVSLPPPHPCGRVRSIRILLLSLDKHLRPLPTNSANLSTAWVVVSLPPLIIVVDSGRFALC